MATGAWETLLTFETGHRPGDLVRALTVLADARESTCHGSSRGHLARGHGAIGS